MGGAQERVDLHAVLHAEVAGEAEAQHEAAPAVKLRRAGRAEAQPRVVQHEAVRAQRQAQRRGNLRRQMRANSASRG